MSLPQIIVRSPEAGATGVDPGAPIKFRLTDDVAIDLTEVFVYLSINYGAEFVVYNGATDTFSDGYTSSFYSANASNGYDFTVVPDESEYRDPGAVVRVRAVAREYTGIYHERYSDDFDDAVVSGWQQDDIARAGSVSESGTTLQLTVSGQGDWWTGGAQPAPRISRSFSQDGVANKPVRTEVRMTNFSGAGVDQYTWNVGLHIWLSTTSFYLSGWSPEIHDAPTVIRVHGGAATYLGDYGGGTGIFLPRFRPGPDGSNPHRQLIYYNPAASGMNLYTKEENGRLILPGDAAFYYSTDDGATWDYLTTDTGLNFSPTRYGIYHKNIHDVYPTGTGYFDWILLEEYVAATPAQQAVWSFVTSLGQVMAVKIYPMLIGGVKQLDETAAQGVTKSQLRAGAAETIDQEFASRIYPMIKQGVRTLDEKWVGGGTPDVYPEPEPPPPPEDEMSRLPHLTRTDAATITLDYALGSTDNPARYRFQDGEWRTWEAPMIWKPTFVGEGGLDAGSEGISRWYYLSLVPKAADDTALTVIGSETSPLSGGLPTGYTNALYIGAVNNNSSGDLSTFTQTVGNIFWRQASANLSLSGGSAVWDGVNRTMNLRTTVTGGYVPETAQDAYLTCMMGLPNGASGQFRFYYNGNGNIHSASQAKEGGGHSHLMPLVDGKFDYRRFQGGGGIDYTEIRMRGWIDAYLPG